MPRLTARLIVPVIALLALLLGAPLGQAAESETPAPAPAPATVTETPAQAAERAYAFARSRSKGPTRDEAKAMIPVFDAAIAAEPSVLKWSIGRAVALRRSGDAEGARTALQAIVKANPKDAEARYELGEAWMGTITSEMGILGMADRAGSAKDEWEAGVKADPNHIMCRYAAAMYWTQARRQGGWMFGSYDKARAHAEALLKIPGGEFWGHMALGAVAAGQEKWDEMSARYTAAETAPGDGAAPAFALSTHASELLNSKKDGAAALTVIERLAPLLPPDSSTPPYMRAEAFRLMEDCAKATEQYEIVLSKNENAQNSRFNAAECYAKMGRRAEAVRHYEEFVARFPKSDRVSKAKAALKKLKNAKG